MKIIRGWSEFWRRGISASVRAGGAGDVRREDPCEALPGRRFGWEGKGPHSCIVDQHVQSAVFGGYAVRGDASDVMSSSISSAATL